MNLQDLKKNILITLKELSEKDFTKEDYNKYISIYEKQDSLLRKGPEYYYIPEGDIVVKATVLYDLIDEIIKTTIKDISEDIFLEKKGFFNE